MGGLEGQTFAGFKVIAKIGQGGMGAVYKAIQPVLNRPVALKILPTTFAEDPAFLARFHREATAAAHLDHPDIVQVHAAGEDSGTHYIAMEFVEGETLEKRLLRVGKFKPVEALCIVLRVAEALAYAWAKTQLVHRDVKPANILLASDGRMKLADLGLAKRVGGSSSMTHTGMAIGSPHYISPEQALGRKDVDFRADIYSLGCTLYHLVTGRLPYESEEALAVMLKHIHEPSPRVTDVMPDCPAPMVKLLDRMLAKDPQLRHRSYEELVAEIRQAITQIEPGYPVSAESTIRFVSPAAWTKVRALQPGKASAIVVGVAVVVAGAVLLIRTVWKSPDPAQAEAPPVLQSANGADAFAREIAALAPEAQVWRVLARLKELNHGFDPATATHRIEKDKVVELSFSTEAVTDVSPVRALSDLRRLSCRGTTESRSLVELSPLRGMRLNLLACSFSMVNDLSPLKGMPLEELNCGSTAVEDLSPLAGMPLVKLDIFETSVRDLTPLAGLPLRWLNCAKTQVRDLRPLQGLVLEELFCDQTAITDFSPLRDLPLRTLRANIEPDRDASVLRSIRALQTINNQPADTFWRQAAAKR